ncbi:MAG: N-acetylglucosamine-6-phosphate deacetylase [Candidatus Sumerlaeia bacterium]|nr:N-acetylglucosamine-6-phosphate deacetylase [Candidatus Sumerlaeia bacterium]
MSIRSMPVCALSTPMSYSIQSGDVVLPAETVHEGTVLLGGGKVLYAGPRQRTPRGFEEINAAGCYVTPGLIDIHCHGAGRFSLDPPDPVSLDAVARRLVANGVLTFFPTMMASEEMIAGLPRLIEASEMSCHIPGIYVEGPFVHPEKRGGIQPPYVRPVDLGYLRRLQKMARGKIRLMTFAPELDRADRLLAAMRRLAIVPCVGHSLATAEQARKVVGRTTVGCTHLFNAMSGLDHHAPGLAAYALNADNVWVELNPDGTHVHPELLRLTARAKRHDRIILMTDAVVSAGDRPGEYTYMGRPVVAAAAGVFYKNDRTLVGSRILLNEGLARFIRYTDMPVHEAVAMASLNPARLVGLSRRKGSLQAGKDADVVVWEHRFVRPRHIFFQGLPLSFR